MELTFYLDPNHGWLEVPLALVDQLGIAHLISTCSYWDDEFAYLEEDRDFAIFASAARETQIPVAYREVTTNFKSFIRLKASF